MQESLAVYLYGKHVGSLDSHAGTLSFRYDPDYLNSPTAVKLSIALPLDARPFGHLETSAFFSGLLPDEQVRKQLARYLHISEANTFALLKEIGGECAGAVSVYAAGEIPDPHQKPEYLVLSDPEAAEILSSLDKRPLYAGGDEIRLSGAGAQNKLMIAWVGQQLAIPKRNTPSTHIIKTAIQGIEDSVFNEYFCMRLAHTIGLPVPETFVHWIEGKPYYVIKRYDRMRDHKGNDTRLHQEDFCQALHVPPEIKYESEGGPSIQDCFELISQRIEQGLMSGKNRLTLLQGMLYNYIIGNGDAHGKNFSIVYDGKKEYLAPFYDLLSTLIYSNPHKEKMAMKISGKYKFVEVTLRHLDKLGQDNGFRSGFVGEKYQKMHDLVTQVAPTLIAELNANQRTQSPVYQKIYNIICRQE